MKPSTKSFRDFIGHSQVTKFIVAVCAAGTFAFASPCRAQYNVIDEDGVIHCYEGAVGGTYWDGETCQQVVCVAGQTPDPVRTSTAPPPPAPCVGSPASCPDNPVGLAAWSVDEPVPNLRLEDTPLIYSASRGRKVRFGLSYKNIVGPQGTNDTQEPRIFSVGQNWHTFWRSYLESIPSEPTNYWVYAGNGSARKVTLGKIDYTSSGKLVQISGTNVMESPEGTTLRFGYTTTVGGVTRHFLTAKQDAYSNTTAFSYLVTNNTIRLSAVTDCDNRSITFEYAPAGVYSNVITKVIAPHGLTTILQYDSSGRLTNITDTVGLRSQFQYDSANLTALITPYGTTTFAYYSISDQMTAIRVFEHGIKNHFFLYYAQVDGGKISSNFSSYVPSTTNGTVFKIANALDHQTADKRNSFHWGPRQYETISDLVRTNLNGGSFNVSNLTSSDYVKGRMKHWLKRASDSSPSRSISFRRDRSADGTTPGQVQWYDYAGKTAGNPDVEGTNRAPCLVAWKLPNNEPRFTYTMRNVLGHPTLTAETYTGSGGSCMLRTNLYEYAANNIDLTRQVQVLGSVSKQVSSNIYNSAHLVITNFNALNEKSTFLYNAKQQLISSTTPGGLTTTNVYDSSGTWSNFLTRQIALGILQTNSMSYSNGYVFTRTDPLGNTRTHVRDGLGRRIRTIHADGTSHTYAYSNLHMVAITNRLGNWKTYDFDSFRQRLARRTALNTNSWAYCSCGTLESTTDAMGQSTTFITDQVGRRIATQYPGGHAVTYNYNSMGWVTNVVDSAGNSITNCYNNQGLVCDVQTSYGYQRRTYFDMEDHSIQMIDANNVSTGVCYDDLGRRICVTNGVGTLSHYRYNSLGLLLQTNQMTNWMGYAYDVAGRKTAETNANGEVTQFKYDSAGNLTNLIDAKGNNAWWKYDQYGRMTNKTDASGQVIFAYAYDAKGQLTNRWTPAKGSTRYVYDSSGNLTLIDYPSSPDISFQYDANNRLTSMIDAVGTTTYTYNERGDLLSEDGPWADDTVSYSYTSNRLRSQLTLLQPNASAWVQTYAYDTASRLTSITSPAGAFTYTYDPVNAMLVRKLALPNGSYITNGFDAMGRMTSTTLKNSSHAILNQHSYLYDDASRRTRQTRTGGDYVDYGYDKIGQVQSAVGYEPGGTTNRWHERFFYTYDKAGNVSNRVQNVQTNVFSVDILNQLTALVRTNSSATVAGTTTSGATNVTVAANGGAATTAIRFVDATFARTNVTLVNGTNTFVAVAGDSLGRWDTNTSVSYLPTSISFLYDQNGNLRTNGTRIFEYDDENQLTRITEPGAWKCELVYDGKLKMRISRDYTWQGSAWMQTNEVRRVYDGMLVLQERDSFNIPTPTYTRGKDLSGSLEGAGGIGGFLAMTRMPELPAPFHVYYHADGNGNVTYLVGTNQNVVARHLYDPFGTTLSSTGPEVVFHNYRYSSKELHGPSGLIYYGYRWYAPELQRWPNRDPLGEVGFEKVRKGVFRLNGYAPHDFIFNKQDPISFVDFYGLDRNTPPPCAPYPDCLGELFKPSRCSRQACKAMCATSFGLLTIWGCDFIPNPIAKAACKTISLCGGTACVMACDSCEDP